MELEVRYKLLPKQKLFISSEKKFSAYVGGIGSGKTWVGCRRALKLMIQYPGCVGVIAAPTYPMLRDATKREFLNICPRELIYKQNKSENSITLINGSEVLFRSCDDPEKLRGPNIDFFYIDEASLCQYMAWKILIGRIRRGIIDIGFITGTPKGRNWVYTEFVEKERDKYILFTSSSDENTFLPEEFVEDLKESYSGLFYRQEVMGEFVGFEGAVYPEFQRETHVFKEHSTEPYERVKFFIDWGFTNPMVCLECAIAGERMWILKEFYQKQVTIEDFTEYLKTRKDKHGIRFEKAIGDPSGAEHISHLNRHGVPCVKANNAVMEGIQAVAEMLKIKGDGKPSLMVHQSCVNTIMEFENYRYPEEKEGKEVREMPLKIFDHAMDAIRYGVMSTRTRPARKVAIAGGRRRF